MSHYRRVNNYKYKQIFILQNVNEKEDKNMETNVEVKYFDTYERFGWYFMVNDCWFYGGESEEECLASARKC